MCFIRSPMTLLVLRTMNNCSVYLLIIKNKIFKNNGIVKAFASWALEFLGRLKTHILNVKISSLRRKHSVLILYCNINFTNIRYGFCL